MRFFQSIWKLLPVRVRSTVFKIRYAISNKYIIYKPTYSDDGLITDHIVDFMKEQRFRSAYENGKSTGALRFHPGEIHFRTYIACWAAEHALNLEGDFVECGVGKGLLSRTIVEYVDFKNVQKNFYLVDTYQGIPIEQGERNEVENMEWLNSLHFNNNYLDEVRNTFNGYKNVILLPGKIPQILRENNFNQVCYLSIDMNNSVAEVSALEFFWEKLVPGAIVLFDDYAYGEQFRAQKDSMDRYVKQKGYPILTLPTGQGMLIKK